MGFEEIPDIQQRSGPGGTAQDPMVLNPFKKYSLVMAADECRFFTLQIPARWYLKIYLTAATREEKRQGRLKAEFIPADPAWTRMEGCEFSRSFQLNRAGFQALLGVGNDYPKRPAYLRLCQEGAPVHITLESQVSSNAALLGPTKK